MARYHGITADTYKKFQIDAGEVYFGFTNFATPGTLMGATRGGSTFTLEQEVRDMEVDGARGPMKESRRITMVKASLTCNFIEHTTESLKRAIVGATSAVFEVNHDKITRALTIDNAADYIDTVAILGDVSGDANGMGIVLKNAIADGNFELNMVDKDEGVVAVTFTAHFDPAVVGAKDDSEPWEILWPVAS